MAPAFASWRALGSRSARAAVKKVLVLEDDDVYRVFDDDDDVYYYIRWRLKLEGETGTGVRSRRCTRRHLGPERQRQRERWGACAASAGCVEESAGGSGRGRPMSAAPPAASQCTRLCRAVSPAPR